MVIFKRLIMVVLLLSLAAAGVWYFAFYNSDEAVIQRRIDKFERLLSKPRDAGNIAEVLANQQMSDMIADGCEVRMVHQLVDGVYSPTRFASVVTHGHALCEELKMEFAHAKISVCAPDAATVTLEASAEAELKGDGGKMEDNRDITIKMTKAEGDWKIASITATPMLTE